MPSDLLGIKFWKVGSRKLFAVKGKGKGKKRKRISSHVDSPDDSDEERRSNKKLDVINAKISQILEVNNHLILPLGFSNVVYGAVKCSICPTSPIIPPVIAGKCCKRIIGCSKCGIREI